MFCLLDVFLISVSADFQFRRLFIIRHRIVKWQDGIHIINECEMYSFNQFVCPWIHNATFIDFQLSWLATHKLLFNKKIFIICTCDWLKWRWRQQQQQQWSTHTLTRKHQLYFQSNYSLEWFSSHLEFSKSSFINKKSIDVSCALKIQYSIRWCVCVPWVNFMQNCHLTDIRKW